MRWMSLSLLLLHFETIHLGSSSPLNCKVEQQEEIVVSERDPTSMDDVEDSLFDPPQADSDCETEQECWAPPVSTLSESTTIINDTTEAATSCLAADATYKEEACQEQTVEPKKAQTTTIVDQHWGSDPNILRMRDRLRETGSGLSLENRRPPIFLMPGLASTRRRHKMCKQKFLSFRHSRPRQRLAQYQSTGAFFH